MAFSCGFFNSTNHDRKYDAVQHGMIFDGIITDGIYATYLKAMVVKASNNPSEVIVQPGRAWFNHTWSYNDADYPIAAPEPEVVLDRIDTLVLDVNSEDAVRDCQFLWVQGTPTSQVPEPPELIHTVTHNQYPLCDVYRQAGTTQIYAADITNRVGTSDCPFVTGVLEGINIDDLLAQWDDEFHTWENATKASFEGWMLNQQAVYTAWWDSLKTQMAGDVADVEEWIETIKDIIDEETATHLQLEIDEINSMLPSGSHITVTTADTELYSRSVSITDEDGHTVTSQFDATGVAVFKSVPYVGNLTIEATDGTRTATAVVDTPYFARYEFPLAFWSATVNITSDTELGGETVTITDSSQILVGTVVLDASGTGVFNATYPDTYKFSVTHGGQTMEVSLAVTQETTYNVTIHAGFNWRGWVDTARDLDSSDYDSLEEVLADELAVRELCLEHACVDYLAAVPSVNSDIETIINNDLFAKWANNSDYSLDILGANVAIKALMDEADKYGYGEWALVGQVPKMTSNSAPYGTVICDSEMRSAYYAFDGDSSQNWNSSKKISEVNSNVYVGYVSTNPIVVKRAMIKLDIEASAVIKIQGSNTGNTDDWHDISEQTSIPNDGAIHYIDCSANSTAYSYHRALYISETASNPTIYAGRCFILQFYAWQPKGNVPVMTSNTAPYGTASATSQSTNSDAYHAFDGDLSAPWVVTPQGTSTNQRLRYKFANPVCVKRFSLLPTAPTDSSSARVKNFRIEASNDGFTTVETLYTGIYDSFSAAPTFYDIENDDYYLEYAIFVIDNYANYTIGIYHLQFYGRELSVSVPVMTSNTTPYGEAFARSEYGNPVENPAYYAFDGNDSTLWADVQSGTSANGAYVGYRFTNPVNVKAIRCYSNAGFSYKIQYSDDGVAYTDANSMAAEHPIRTAFTDFLVADTDYGAHKYWRLILTSAPYSTGNVNTLQFYGLDYSEKEFEEGVTKKWLYDHGVELAEFETTKGSTTTSAVPYNDGSELYSPTLAGTNNNVGTFVGIGISINLSNYNMVRSVIGSRLKGAGNSYNSAGEITAWASKPTGQYNSGDRIATKDLLLPLDGSPYEFSIDVSAVNALVFLGLFETYYTGRENSIKELWLE